MTKTFDQLWAETFRYAAECSPFYRELFRGQKAVPALANVPLLDKPTLSERNLDFLCVPRERVVEIVTTSGTTGNPLLWMLTEADVKRLAVNEQISFGCAGLTANDTVVVAVAMDRCFMAGQAYWLGLREIGCGIVRTGATSPLLVLEMIQRVQPTAIVGVPSFLRIVAEKAREAGLDLRKTSVRKLICIGEPIRDAAFRLNHSGATLEAAWGAKVYSTYGVTELANSLCECEVGQGGHLHDQQLHLEILDDAGQPVADGEVGEVVATTFGVEAMPVIRYRTGDCAALYRGKCACGRTTPRLGPIIGRKNQKLKFKGTSLYPATLAAVLEQSAAVEAFVIIARKENELSDAVEVLVHGAVPVAQLREAFQARAKIAPQIRHATREEIEALQMPPQARKRRTFVDLRHEKVGGGGL
ncbi:MAG: AMP-binding protein [Proteobacteria bacterium]|nr:AMP-binding protein [Pseudomonadota bacterium]